MYHLSPLFTDKTYIKLQFRHLMGYRLDLEHPTTFQEKLQWLKLNDRKPIYHQMVDKYEAKRFIEERIGAEYVIPTLGLYDTANEIDYDTLPEAFVMKTTHDSGTVIVSTDKASLDKTYVQQFLTKRLKRNYYYTEREWPYKGLKPRIIIEENINTDNEDLKDYKFFCFDGEPQALYITTNRGMEGGLKEDFFYANGEHMEVNQEGYHNNPITPQLPINFEKMKDLARILAAGIPQLRVDFYEVKGKVYVGELTFSDGGGYAPFAPKEYDTIFGDWIKLPTDK